MHPNESDLLALSKEAETKISNSSQEKELEEIRICYLGKQSSLTLSRKLLANISDTSIRKSYGSLINSIWDKLSLLIYNKKQEFIKKNIESKLESEWVDVTLPPRPHKFGKLHPINKVINEIKNIFSCMGFYLADGPEIEDQYYVFDALNTPFHHPARNTNDTFYLKDNSEHEFSKKEKKKVLRTHTSSVQIRYMESNNIPPLKVVSPGRVFRNDWDYTHSPMFHQLEGFYIDQNVHMGHLKSCVKEFLSTFFGQHVKLRFRNSFFPFTEPSAEVDVFHNNSWLEILGCGMIHPKVLQNVNIDPDIYSGFAFGIGIERITMLKYDIKDLRNFYRNNMDWLSYYGFDFTTLKL